MKTKFITLAFGTLLFVSISFAQEAQQKTNPEITQLAQSVAGKAGSTEDKTRRLVNWINTNFKWSYTDYQKRTVEEIIQRRAGNCAELANVLAAMLKENNISFRWISEINIQPKKESRLKSAAKLVSERGKSASVFGLMHNDHVWLEVMEGKNNTWFPADPAVGVVGMNEWISARAAFNERRKPMVPAVVPIVEEMLIPIMVIAREKRGGKPVENRSEFYLVNGFNSFYGKKLQKLPSWNEWKTLDNQFSLLGSSAFAGETNLHEHGELIEQLSQVYEKLKTEAAERKISPKSSK